MRRSKPIIGLCGGIGSGKSLAADAMRSAGALVVDSDRLSREILERPEVRETIASWWGRDVLHADGRVNRRRLADIVFADDAAKRRLEGLIHPLIARERAHMISRGLTDKAVKAIILDSPLLFESNLDQLCDAIVFVESDEKQRLERVRQSRGWDADELRRRERSQWPLEKKRAQAQVVLRNDDTPEELRRRSVQALEDVTKRFVSRER